MQSKRSCSKMHVAMRESAECTVGLRMPLPNHIEETAELPLKCCSHYTLACAQSIAGICTNAHAHVHKWVWAKVFFNMYIFGLETARAERKMSAEYFIIMYANPGFFRETTPLDSTPVAAKP